MSYSVAMSLKAAINYELQNTLKAMPIDQIDENIVAVIDYFEKRLKEIENQYG